MKRQEVIVTIAVVRTVHMASMSPYFPVKPEDIIRQAVNAYTAGAALTHIHGRDRKTGEPTSDIGLIWEVVSGIKERCDAIVCITTGSSQMTTVGECISVVPALRPELASCDAGSMDFVLSDLVSRLKPDDPEWEYRYLDNTYDNVFTNAYYDIETYIRTMQGSGTVPEFEVYDAGMISNIIYFRNKGILTGPVYIQFIMGIQGGIPVTAGNLVFLQTTTERLLEDSFTWSVAATGKHQMPIAAVALTIDSNVCMEPGDNLYIRPHQLAKSNAEQVHTAATMAGILGREVAASDEARAILGLKGKNQVNY